MRARVRLVAIITALGMVACGDSTPRVPPTAPTPQAPTAPTPQPQDLVRTTLTPGEVYITGTGQSARVSVLATLGDGSTRDVTADVTWQVDKPEVVSIDHGLLTGQAYGSTTFSGVYRGQVVGPGLAVIRIPAELLAPLTGVLRDQYGRPVPDARIVGTGPVGVGATTDANGSFDLGMTYGSLQLTITKFGYETRDVMLQVTGTPLHARLVLPESPSPYTERVFDAEGGVPWQTHHIDARAGAPLDVLVESPACDYRRVVGVLTVRLRSGGVQVGDEIVGCTARVRQIMPSNEAQLEVTVSTPATYRVTYRVPR